VNTAANPAVLSRRFLSLFPTGVVAAELREPGNPELLLPAEAVYLGRSVPKRVQEFAAGRLCARRAMAEFGVEDFALQVAGDRQPIWPDTLVGSITHTAGLCVAVVAERRLLAALGMDSEIVGDATRDTWPTICSFQEAAWIESLPAPQQAQAVTLIFSAKEAFYKCQYPLTGEWLNFHDLLVEPLGWGPETAAFSIRSTRRLALEDHVTLPIPGQYLFHQQYVSTGVALPAADTQLKVNTPSRRETTPER
jgi:4'-phosphopantetheinyl transferase EntD